MIFLATLGSTLCHLVVKCFKFTSLLLPWFALNMIPLFEFFVLIRLASIYLVRFVVSLLNSIPVLVKWDG